MREPEQVRAAGGGDTATMTSRASVPCMNEREWAANRRALASGFKESQGLILALGDPTRQHIIMALLEAEQCGLRVGEITKLTNLSRPAVSHHMKILKDAKVVAVRREGTMNFYHIAADDAEWAKLKRLIDRVCQLVVQAKREGYMQDE